MGGPPSTTRPTSKSVAWTPWRPRLRASASTRRAPGVSAALTDAALRLVHCRRRLVVAGAEFVQQDHVAVPEFRGGDQRCSPPVSVVDGDDRLVLADLLA